MSQVEFEDHDCVVTVDHNALGLQVAADDRDLVRRADHEGELPEAADGVRRGEPAGGLEDLGERGPAYVLHRRVEVAACDLEVVRPGDARVTGLPAH